MGMYNQNLPPGQFSVPSEMNNGNNSGYRYGHLPPELHYLNWGAFFLGWLWGLGHNAWTVAIIDLVLSLFCPGIGSIIYRCYLLFSGNDIAWKSRRFANMFEFKSVEKIWSVWGVVIFIVSSIISITVFVILLITGVLAGFWAEAQNSYGRF